MAIAANSHAAHVATSHQQPAHVASYQQSAHVASYQQPAHVASYHSNQRTWPSIGATPPKRQRHGIFGEMQEVSKKTCMDLFLIP